MTYRSLSTSACLLVLTAVWAQAADPTAVENFDKVPDKTPLDQVEGWSRNHGTGEVPEVLTAAGYEGQGARFQGKGTFLKRMDVIPESGDTTEFRMKFRVMADTDAYSITQIMLTQDGPQNLGVSGLNLRFNGGAHDGRQDNFIQVATGGRNWTSVELSDLPEANWSKGTWYEIIVSDIRPLGVEPGQPMAKLRIVEADGSGQPLVDNVELGRIGNANAFTGINALVIGNVGAGHREVDIDDISVSYSH